VVGTDVGRTQRVHRPLLAQTSDRCAAEIRTRSAQNGHAASVGSVSV
jgi:hypothetical protein